MYISCKGITKDGVFCQNVDVEMDISRGLFSFLIVGLADKCIGESRERIISAIKNSGFNSPKTKNHKIIASLVPAGIKKEGVLLDLTISIAYLSAIGIIDKKYTENSIFVGELGLDGSIKSNDSLATIINSILKDKDEAEVGLVEDKKKDKIINIYSNFKDEQIVLINKLNLASVKIFKVINLKELVCYLNSENKKIQTLKTKNVEKKGNLMEDGDININTQKINTPKHFEIDGIIGQEKAKRAILISLCGNYHILMAGPPGIGKTKLAQSMHQLLKTPKTSEYLEILSIHNKLERPFRTPHHTSSYTSIIGGGNPIVAGEITKAHKGILFLDELPEFGKNIIEALRQPLEQKVVQINRTGDTVLLPCDILCVCAMNLCPCGNTGTTTKICNCSGIKINLYKQKVSQPFLERFHISINLISKTNRSMDTMEIQPPTTLLLSHSSNLTGEKILKIVNKFENKDIDFHWKNDVLEILHKISEKRGLSMRGIKHIKEISETICLIEEIETNGLNTGGEEFVKQTDRTKLDIKNKHVIEAFSYKDNLFFQLPI